MYKLFETINGQKYSSVCERVFEHDGCIVDIGCLFWDWSSFFIGKKRIIGIDPFEKKIDGVELFSGLIGSKEGIVTLKDSSGCSTIYCNNNGGKQYEMITWKTFCEKFNIDKISVLKINIEGSEYDLINSMTQSDFEKIDQITISFHHFLNKEWEEKTNKAVSLIEKMGFYKIQTNVDYGWYLFIKQ